MEPGVFSYRAVASIAYSQPNDRDVEGLRARLVYSLSTPLLTALATFLLDLSRPILITHQAALEGAAGPSVRCLEVYASAARVSNWKKKIQPPRSFV